MVNVLVLLLSASARLAIAAPIFATKPCDPPMPAARAICGTVDVPEDPAAPGGRTIALNVMIVRPAKSVDRAVPMFYLEGGPGVAATGAADFYLGPGALYAETRAVVLIDQRGTGASNALRCPDQERRKVWDDEYDPARVDACRRALEARADLLQ